jgi:predicted RNase H-like nuclease
MYKQYKKSIAAAVAWVGTLCVAGSDLSLSTEEISALVVGLLGVYAVYKARNQVV